MPSIEEIPYGSDAYRTVLGFRDQILRRPLGLSLNSSDTSGEEAQRHFVLKNADAILAGVIVMKVDTHTVRLRQMWVRQDVAGSGMGRALLSGVEDILRKESYQEIALHARLSVRGFYEKCGYSVEGGVFDEIGIPHIIMTRRIISP